MNGFFALMVLDVAETFKSRVEGLEMASIAKIKVEKGLAAKLTSAKKPASAKKPDRATNAKKLSKSKVDNPIEVATTPSQDPKGEGVVKSVARKTRPKVAAVDPLAFLSLPALAEAIAETTSQAIDLIDAQQRRVSARRLLREEIGFIGNANFGELNAGNDMFQEAISVGPPEPATSAARRRLAELPAHLGRLCEAKLLTPVQERMLFQRMNYLRYLADRIRSTIDMENIDFVAIDRVEQLLAIANWHRDRIVEANLRLVFSIVKKFVNRFNAFEDLLSDGITALMRAVDKFDYDRGFRFSTYATQVVRRNAYRTVVQRQRDRQRLTVGLSDAGVDIVMEDREPTISEHRWHELRSRLSLMLGDLDRREKLIIRSRFSLGSHRKVHTLQDLATRLKVSKERVRQLEKRAMEKLRVMAGNSTLVDLAV
jgi:RNA polymerase primary sigma factor